MRAFVKFLAAAGRWGVTLMTGGLLSLGIAVYEHLRGSSLGAAAFATIGGIALLLGGFLAWKEEHEKRVAEGVEKDAIISRLTEKPEIRGDILAVFWEFGETNYGMEIGKNSRYYVKLRLVNHNDVPCTINEYHILAADLDGQRAGFGLGMPSHIGKLRHPGSAYRDERTEAVWDEKFREDKWTWTNPINIVSQWPLERARKQEGWITFDVLGYIPSPIKDEDAPSEYLHVAPWQQRITIRVVDSLGEPHDFSDLYADVAAVSFTRN